MAGVFGSRLLGPAFPPPHAVVARMCAKNRAEVRLVVCTALGSSSSSELISVTLTLFDVPSQMTFILHRPTAVNGY